MLQGHADPQAEYAAVAGGSLRSAAATLETAEQAFREIQHILISVPPSEEVLAWLKALDYDRLYQDGIQGGLIPASIDQWDRLVRITRTQEQMGAVADVLVADVCKLQTQLQSLSQTLISSGTATPLTSDAAHGILGLQAALAEFTAFEQMVAYVDAIEPRTLAAAGCCPTIL